MSVGESAMSESNDNRGDKTMKPSTCSKIAQAVRENTLITNDRLVNKPMLIDRLNYILAESDPKFDKARFLSDCNQEAK
mgnify:CR=1 FL=1